MNNNIQTSLTEALTLVYNRCTEKPLEILEVFNDFFGEDKVDMQGMPSLDKFISDIKVTNINTWFRYSTLPSSSILFKNRYYTTLDIIIQNNNEEALKEIIEYTTDIDGDVLIKDLFFNNIFILVHFPEVRVTNENGRYEDITHLYAKIQIQSNGTIYDGFSLNRSEYTVSQLRADYMHSHVSSIPTENFACFKKPCLGTGPIKDTIISLINTYDKSLWELFCLELSKYITVESLSGVPYRKLESIHTGTKFTMCNNVASRFYFYSQYNINVSKIIEKFITYFVSLKKLKFSYTERCYSLGMSNLEYLILVSNSFIEWYNKQYNENEMVFSLSTLLDDNILIEAVIKDGEIYIPNRSEYNRYYNQLIGKYVCKFKGKDITINIIDDNPNIVNKCILLNDKIANFILSSILKVLNCYYGREEFKTSSKVRVL